MVTNAEDDLAPTETEGFKVGEKKTVEEYQKLGELQLNSCTVVLPSVERRWGCLAREVGHAHQPWL